MSILDPLSATEIKPLIVKAGNLQLGHKVPVYVYDANTLELVNNTPFDSLLATADYFCVNYRTIARHVNTNKANPSLWEKERDLKILLRIFYF